jgi:hypothetical protein
LLGMVCTALAPGGQLVIDLPPCRPSAASGKGQRPSTGPAGLPGAASLAFSRGHLATVGTKEERWPSWNF